MSVVGRDITGEDGGRVGRGRGEIPGEHTSQEGVGVMFGKVFEGKRERDSVGEAADR